MALDKTGAFLEGIRTANSNNSLTYPPRTLISNFSSFNSIENRAEYIVSVSGQTGEGIYISDPNLEFFWSRNDHSINRFDWDGFSKRWDTLPGSSPESIGGLSNSPRLISPIPDPDVSLSVAPFLIYIGLESKILNFSYILVPSSDDFGSPSAGTVEISQTNGEINFSNSDVQNYLNQKVYVQRQSFFDRNKFKGSIGNLPNDINSDYFLFLNPIPGPDQYPRVRIGYEDYLTPIEYLNDNSLQVPPVGYFSYSVESGRILFSPTDIQQNLGSIVYYSGVYNGSFKLNQYQLGSTSNFWPNSSGSSSLFLGLTDSKRYIFFCEPNSNSSYYFQVQIVDGAQSEAPDVGFIYVDSSSGKVYISPDDETVSQSLTIKFIDSLHEIENGVSIQFYRSGANSFGFPISYDFFQKYSVSRQIIQNGLMQVPFVQIPTIPIDDDFLKYTVEQGTSGGTFTGEILDSSDTSNLGIGYIKNFDSKQIKISNRKVSSKSIQRPTSSIKLDDAAINTQGLEISINSEPKIAGTDFLFDSNTGLIEFIETVGQDDPFDVLNITVNLTPPNFISAPTGTFPDNSVGGFVFIKSGPDFGFWEIKNLFGSSQVEVYGSFQSSGSFEADFRTDREILADRFWIPLLPELKKFKLYKSNSISGQFIQMDRTEFSVLPTTGQVNLIEPSSTGDVYRIEYESQDSEDEVNITYTQRTEFAGFKIRQEQATYSQNTGVINFNFEGKTVDSSYGFTVYIDGVSQEVVTYQSPDKLIVPQQLNNQVVFVDYYVNESPGGNTNFNTRNSPVTVDLPSIVNGSNSISLNGDFSDISVGSPLLVDDESVLLVSGVSYDSASDITTLTINPSIYVDSDGSNLKYSNSISGTYLEPEPNQITTFSLNTNFFYISNQVSYPSGTVIIIDNDPYLVINSQYDQVKNRTKIVLSTNARKNYILSSLKRTIRPIFSPTDSFQTSKSARSDRTFLLVLSGDTNEILLNGSDYDLSDGGQIKTSNTISGNSTLSCCYVARLNQPTGTEIVANYSYLIAPDSSNGLIGQKLVSQYNLLNPDTFYFRYETFDTFLPELLESLESSSSSGGSGPNTSDASSLANKDYGISSPYFDEQHYGNLDSISARLLKFYNDQINDFENILANYDGRVVGGSSGRFRFDGDLSGNRRNSYEDIQNDIDDYIKLYDDSVVVSFNPLTFEDGPVYGAMWDYNSLSRLYKTAHNSSTVAFNDNVATPGDFGKTLGNFDIKNLSSVGIFRTTPSRAKFTSIDVNGTVLKMVGENGDPDGKWPPFYTGQKVLVCSGDGITGDQFDVVSITQNPFSIEISGPTSTPSGSLLADISDSSFPGVHYYSIGRHISVDFETGQVKNAQLPPPIGPTTDVLEGNELVDSDITYFNQNIKPYRFPALDGEEYDDRNQSSTPQLLYSNEKSLIEREELFYSTYGKGSVTLIDTVSNSSLTVEVGQTIQFLNGPNAGPIFAIATIGPIPASFTVTPNFTTTDLTLRDFIIINSIGPASSIFSDELGVTLNNSNSSPVSGAIIGNIDSEVKSAESIVLDSGQELVNSSGTVTNSSTLLDLSVDFTTVSPEIDDTCVVIIESGTNRGVYSIGSFTQNTLSVVLDSSFSLFPTLGSVSYKVIKPWDFEPEDVLPICSEIIRSSLSFYSLTLSWSGIFGVSSIPLFPIRIIDINSRLNLVNGIIPRIESILGKGGKLYDSRFLWISQRVDKKNGYLSRVQRAIQDRLELEIKISEDQQKLIAVRSLQ